VQREEKFDLLGENNASTCDDDGHYSNKALFRIWVMEVILPCLVTATTCDPDFKFV